MEGQTNAYQHCDTCKCKKFGWAVILEETETTNLIRFICRTCNQTTKHTIQVFKKYWVKAS